MRRLRDVEAKLAEALLKAACAFVFGNPAVATMTRELGSWAIQAAARPTPREVRTVRAELHNLVESIAEHIVRQYGEEFRDLASHECAAAIFAVARTFEDDAVFEVAKTDLSPSRMLACLRRRRATVLASERLDPDARELYDLVLDRVCSQLVSLLGELPQVRTAVMGETLTRLRALVDQVVTTPEKIFASARNSDDTEFTRFYRDRGPRALELVDLHSGLLPTRRRYPLAEAYLQSMARLDDDPGHVLPAEHALVDAPRLLFTGPPGIGKTTLIKRFFRLASRQAFAAPLTGLNDRVPFYVPLRAHQGMPEPAKFLHPVLSNWTGLAPDGWVERQLRGGRGLIMANGLDELPANVRGPALDRLTDFALEVSEQGNIFVLTSRRAAITPDWARQAGFRCVELLPFPPQDGGMLVTRWHDAAMAATPGAHERSVIAQRRDELLGALARNCHLRMLATNPLCCALLCALHLEKDVQLPQDWVVLIDLVMTALADRDTERGVPTAATLSSMELLALERDFANWVVTNGPMPVDRAQAEVRVAKSLGQLGRADLDVAAVLHDLVCRSSILCTMQDGRITFANDVLRDHLAASEFITGNDIGFLRKEARDPERHRLIVAAAARARGHVLEDLVGGLLGDADQLPTHADWLRQLSHAATRMAPGATAELTAGTTPPQSHPTQEQHDESACELMLDQLPDTESLDDNAAAAVVRDAVALAQVIGAEALPALARFAVDGRHAVQQQLWEAWPAFDRILYASLVLRRCPSCPGQVTVDCQAVITAVADHLPEVQTLVVTGCQIDLTPLAGRQDLAVHVVTPDDVSGAELLADTSTLIVVNAEGGAVS